MLYAEVLSNVRVFAIEGGGDLGVTLGFPTIDVVATHRELRKLRDDC